MGNLKDANKIARSVVDLIFKLSVEEERIANRFCRTNDGEVLQEDDGEEKEESRWDLYQHALSASKESDSQSYIIDSSEFSGEDLLSWKDLSAISWAAFCSNSVPADDETY